MSEQSSSRLRHLAAPLAIAAVLVAGCSDDTNESTQAGATPPLPEHPGAGAYAEHCAACHGTDLRGTDQGPSHLSQVYEPGHHPDWSFELAIREGVRAHHWSFGDMPAIEGMSDTEIDEVIAYVRAVQEAEGFEPYPPS